MPASLLFAGARRMEAENYLAGGYGVRLALEARTAGWRRFQDEALISQPARLKGVQVAREHGTPFLAATQVFDVRPTPRKWLALDQVRQPQDLLVDAGVILVTRSGTVGRTTLAYSPHENTVISDDLIRVRPRNKKMWGWLYAYLRAQQVRAMMTAARYGHVVKHLEVGHVAELPLPLLQDDLLGEFHRGARSLLDMRVRAHELLRGAERLFSEVVGDTSAGENLETGFTVGAAGLFGARRRLEASFHSPEASAILRRFAERSLKVEPLANVSERVWWLPRFKRVFGDDGAPYMSADELFSLNPSSTKTVMVEQAEDAEKYFVRAGWIVMACSGQTYGLNGSVALMTARHEESFLSHDLVRIIPRSRAIRSGYLFVALGHPRLGRPLVIRNAYGTSVPHLDPGDVSAVPIVRLEHRQEAEIADRAEEAIGLRAAADALEDELTHRAESLIERFIAGDARALKTLKRTSQA